MDSTLRQPKKRFVGRRTAEAQAQATPTTGDVESTAVQKGIQKQPLSHGAMAALTRFLLNQLHPAEPQELLIRFRQKS